MAPPLIPPAPERTVHQHRPPIKGTYYSVIPIHIQHLNTPSFTSPAPPSQATAARRRRTPPLSLLYHSNSYPTLEHSPRSPAISSLPIINTMAKRKTSSRVALLIEIHYCFLSISISSMFKNAICHTKECPPLFSNVENCLWKNCTKLAFMHGVHNLGNLSGSHIGIVQDVYLPVRINENVI